MLKQRRLIRPLFSRVPDSDSLATGCLRAVFRIVPRSPGMPPVQVGFAPGRRVGNAVRRNRIKRLLREVYRCHQEALIDLFSRRDAMLTLMLLFRGDPQEACRQIPSDGERLINRLAEQLRRELPELNSDI